MPPGLTTTPAVINASLNKIPLVVESPEGEYLAAAPAIAVNFLQFTAAVAADTSYLLSWGTGTATMTAKAVPDDSGLQFITGDGSNGYVTSLLDYFNGNPFLDRDFVLTTDFTGLYPRIIFTAKSPGPQYDFTTANAGASGVITAGVTNQPVSNFCHNIQLWIATGGAAPVQAYTANVPLDGLGTGQTSMDIKRELHAFLKSDRPVMATAYAKCINSIGQFNIKYAQFKGSPASVQRVFTSANFYINKGGLGMQQNLQRSLVEDLCPGTPSQNRFLRSGSNNKVVTAEQPEWLTFINFSGANVNFNLEVQIFNRDTSTTTFTLFADPLVIAPYEKYQFATGYTQLSIGSRQIYTKVPIYYTVRAKNSGTYISAPYAYVLDYNYREWPRYIIYENSYSAFQTLATVGKGQPEYDRTKTDAQLAVDGNHAASEGEFIECNIYIQDKATVNIGYDRSGQRPTALLRDLMLSHTNYLYDNGTLIPIGFNTKNLKDALDGTNVYANSLEYFIKYNEETYTEAAGLPDDSIPGLSGDASSPAPGEGGTPPLNFNAIIDDDNNDDNLYYYDI